MVERLFEITLRMSMYGVMAGAAACGVSCLVRRLPVSRRVGFLLWAVVGLRLVCPVTLPLPVPSIGERAGKALGSLLDQAGSQWEGRWLAADLSEEVSGSGVVNGTEGKNSGSGVVNGTDGEKISSGAVNSADGEDIGYDGLNRTNGERGGSSAVDSAEGKDADSSGVDRMDAGSSVYTAVNHAGAKNSEFGGKGGLLYGSAAENAGRADSWASKLLSALAPLWLAGVLIVWCGGVVAALRFRWRLRFAMEVEPGVCEVDTIDSPCVFGLLRPVIYLTPGLEETQKQFILCHERAHIHHGDHLWKAAAYGIMGLHWFNIPLWFIYRFFQKELEKNCDEAVVASMGAEKRGEYCEVLLTLATERRRLGFVSPAFGEKRGKNDMKDRVEQILKYRKPRKGVQAAVMALSLVIGVSLVSGGNALGADTRDQSETEALGETVGMDSLAEQLYGLKNPYVGNAPGDGALLNALKPYIPADGISMELETDQEPYGLILKLEEDPEEPEKRDWMQEPRLEQTAALLLALIDNLDQVVWEYQDTAEGEETLVRLYMDTKWAAETWKLKDIKEYGTSPEAVRELLELVEWRDSSANGAGEAEGSVNIGNAGEMTEENREDTSVSVIGGADGPTSIWIAGKEDGDEIGKRRDSSSRTAVDFLIDFFTVRRAEADGLAESLSRETQEMEEQMKRQWEEQAESGEAEQSSGAVIGYTSKVTEALLAQEPFTLLDDKAKERLTMNRWLFFPYQLSVCWEEDVNLASCGLEIIKQEDGEAQYEYTARIEAGEAEDAACEISGQLHVVLRETDEWVIDEMTMNVLTEEIQDQAARKWSTRLTEQ